MKAKFLVCLMVLFCTTIVRAQYVHNNGWPKSAGDFHILLNPDNMAEGQVTDTSAEREGKTVCEDMSHTSQRERVHGESVKGVTYENGQGVAHHNPAHFLI